MQAIPVNCVSSGKKNAQLRIKIGLGELCLNGSKTVLQNPVLCTSSNLNQLLLFLLQSWRWKGSCICVSKGSYTVLVKRPLCIQLPSGRDLIYSPYYRVKVPTAYLCTLARIVKPKKWIFFENGATRFTPEGTRHTPPKELSIVSR